MTWRIRTVAHVVLMDDASCWGSESPIPNQHAFEPTKRGPVEIAQVVARAIEMVSPLLEQRRHALDVDVPAESIVDADENRLAQVLSNLLNNAAHYTEAGGHVRIAARREGQMVAIEVSDDGVGIAEEALSSIFELFVQGPSRSSRQGGLGLGLVVVKQLTELHGGSVSVARQGDGRGTKFTVRLPLDPREPSCPASCGVAPFPSNGRSSAGHARRRQRRRARSPVYVLRGAGHEVAAAHDGLDALAVLARFHPSVAVIDIGMPVMSGTSSPRESVQTSAASSRISWP